MSDASDAEGPPGREVIVVLLNDRGKHLAETAAVDVKVGHRPGD